MERTFSETMSTLRRARGLSQRAAAADLLISQALLSHYENGAREPGLAFLCRACKYYGVTADYLLGLSDENGGSAERAALSDALEALETLTGQLRGVLEGDQ